MHSKLLLEVLICMLVYMVININVNSKSKSFVAFSDKLTLFLHFKALCTP